MLSYCVSLRCVFRVPHSAYKRCSVHLYIQLFVGELMFYLRYLCLFAHGGVHHILCCVYVLFFVVYVASFSGLSIFDYLFGIL